MQNPPPLPQHVPASELAAVIRQMQSRFVRAASPHRVFDAVLPDLLRLSGSEYGFIGEVWRDSDGTPYLKIHAVGDISWDAATRARVERERVDGLEFRNLDELLGDGLRSAEPVLTNDLPADSRHGGLPTGHPALKAFLRLPLHYGGDFVGMMGLANRRGGYNLSLAAELEPLTQAMAGIIGAVQLDRDRRRAEAALRESERRYRMTFELAAVGIAHTSLDGRLYEVNERFCEMLGYTRDAVQAMHFKEITHPDDVAQNLASLRNLLSGQIARMQTEKRYRRADGSYMWAQLTVALARDAQGQPEHFIAVVQDISDRKRSEEAELSARAAEQANAAKSAFLSRMSHELRTPLNAVQGFAQLLQMDMTHVLSPTQRARVQHIERAGEHLLAMINDVLDLSRIEAANMTIVPTRVALGSLVGECLAMAEVDALRAGVSLHVEAASPIATRVRADPTRLRQVLMHLLSNAIKYNRRGGKVHVAWHERPAGDAQLSIADTGFGLNADQLAHLFEPFNRLGAESSGIEGTGIGLVITQRLIRLMGGEVQVESEAGRGTRVLVNVPLDDSNAPRGDTVHGALAPVAAPRRPARTILVAEDDPLNVELVRQVLALRPEWRVLAAHSGEQALALASKQPIDLLLLDLQLGDMTGQQVAQRLLSEPRAAACPRVALSADTMPERVQATRDAGFSAYLTKPLDVAALLRCLDELLE